MEEGCKIKKEQIQELMQEVREDTTKKSVQLFKDLKEDIKKEMELGSMKQKENDDLRRKIEEVKHAKDLLHQKVEILEFDMKKKEMHFEKEMNKFENGSNRSI